MAMTRRRFLVGLALVVALAGAGVAWQRRARIARALVRLPLPPAPPGPLDQATQATLRAMTLTLLGERIELELYENLFGWRAEHQSGYRALYARFAAMLDRDARAAGAPDFARAPLPVRRGILAGFRPARGWRKAERLLLERDRARVTSHIVRDVMELFARTDAWILSGYDSWPGQPRGQEAYHRFPGAS